MNVKVDLSFTELASERLLLRPFEAEDLYDLYEYGRDPRVAAGAGWRPARCLDDSRAVLRMFIEGKKTLAVTLKKGGRVIGSISLDEHSQELPAELLAQPGRELGYALNQRYWGQGFATEAARRLISYCFTEEHYAFLSCSHFSDNRRSARVIEKCGFNFCSRVPFRSDDGREHWLCCYYLKNPQVPAGREARALSE